MKPSSRDYQLGLASPLNYAAIQSGNIKNPSKKEAGLDVSHHALVSREGRGENFFLDILFHRMDCRRYDEPCVRSYWPRAGNIKPRNCCGRFPASVRFGPPA